MKSLLTAVTLLLLAMSSVSCGDDSAGGGPVTPAEVDDVMDSPEPIDLPGPATTTEEESPTGEVVGDAFFNILVGIVCNSDGVEQRDAMIASLQKAFRSTLEGDAPELDMRTEIAITDTVADVLDDLRNERGIAGPELDDQQHTMLVQLARRYADNAHSRAKDGIAKQHEGVILAAPSVDTADVPKGYLPVKWSTLGGFTYKEGMELPEEVMALNGKKIAMTGYMMSIGQFENIHTFILVESGWSCCFGEVPDTHQVLMCTIPEDEIGLDNIVAPILVTGTLDIGEEVEDGWVVSLYRTVCDDVQELD